MHKLLFPRMKSVYHFGVAEFILKVIPTGDDAKKRDEGWEERQESTSGKECSGNMEISEYRV